MSVSNAELNPDHERLLGTCRLFWHLSCLTLCSQRHVQEKLFALPNFILFHTSRGRTGKFFFKLHILCSQCAFFGGMYCCKFPPAWVFHPFFCSKRPGRAPRFAIRVKPRSSHECQSLCQFPVCKSSALLKT